MMSTIHRLIAVMIVMVLVSCAPTNVEFLAEHQEEPFFFRLTNYDGTPTTLEAYRGRKSIFLFWAQHCMRSRWLIKELGEKSVSGEIPADVSIVVVNVDKFANFPKVVKFLEEINTSRIEVMVSGNDIDDEAYVACGGQAVPLVVTFDENLRMKTRGLAGEGLDAALAFVNSPAGTSQQ